MWLGGPRWETERLTRGSESVCVYFDNAHLLFHAIPLFFFFFFFYSSFLLSSSLVPNPPGQLILTTILSDFFSTITFIFSVEFCGSACTMCIITKMHTEMLCFQCSKPQQYHLIYMLLCLFQFDISFNFVVNKNLRYFT